ncbi:hypothetical protein [Streptomyces sp. NPDC020489]|uniref:hypothetical protein n=1 Tax=Streptomyces sp. NPDC020489 TaxID=3365077 RepID=UPI0037B8F7E0
MTERTANLYTAIEADRQAREKAREEAAAPERERQEKQAAADAKLMGTPAWDTIGMYRRHRATQHATRPVQGDDTTAQTVVALAQGQAQGGGDDAA